jgi:hypothetical protein
MKVVSEPESNRTQSGGKESCFCIDFIIANDHGVKLVEMGFEDGLDSFVAVGKSFSKANATMSGSQSQMTQCAVVCEQLVGPIPS